MHHSNICVYNKSLNYYSPGSYVSSEHRMPCSPLRQLGWFPSTLGSRCRVTRWCRGFCPSSIFGPLVGCNDDSVAVGLGMAPECVLNTRDEALKDGGSEGYRALRLAYSSDIGVEDGSDKVKVLGKGGKAEIRTEVVSTLPWHSLEVSSFNINIENGWL